MLVVGDDVDGDVAFDGRLIAAELAEGLLVEVAAGSELEALVELVFEEVGIGIEGGG